MPCVVKWTTTGGDHESHPTAVQRVPSSRLCEYARRRNSFTSLPNDGRRRCYPVPFPRPFVLNYFANASWFLTDFTPGTPRAISEALALAPIVAT
jgi:hypothetical protein